MVPSSEEKTHGEEVHVKIEEGVGAIQLQVRHHQGLSGHQKIRERQGAISPLKPSENIYVNILISDF
jgi:hypothetical protein